MEELPAGKKKFSAVNIIDPQGIERASLSVDSANRVVLQLRDGGGMPCIVLAVEKDGTAHIEIRGEKDETGLAIGHSSTEGTGLCMNYASGKFGILLTVPPHTPATVVLLDTDGNPVWSQGVGSQNDVQPKAMEQ